MSDNKTILFEYRCHLNGNVHIKFNKEFIKKLNVVVGKELGWIKNKEDVVREFDGELAKGSENYFDFKIELPNVSNLIG